jgi:small subunit ribosomal protein S9
MSEDPKQPEQPEGEPGGPADEAPAGAPGEPGEASPAEPAPEAAGDAAESEPGEEAAQPEAGGEDVQPGDEEVQPEATGEDEEPRPAGDEAADAVRAERPRPGRRRKQGSEPSEEVIPGAHLEPDLVLEEQRPQEEGEYGEYGEYAEADLAPEDAEGVEEPVAEPEPVARQPLDIAADARYGATGKRKSAVARVILKPGEGTYSVNGRHLDEYFPRVRLQRLARQPLEAAGYQTRMDVVVRVHGGGVSAQATAVRHGIARALVEADPALRSELKRRGYLTRDPRVKERKKAGLKKARKRPQFSKR